MDKTRMPAVFVVALLVVSLPFVIIHLRANPDDSPITPLQHVVAALANYVGPWGVLVVRLVDFPNAGLRAFSLPLACGLTVLGAIFVALSYTLRGRAFQVLLVVVWVLFLLVWFGVGLVQIASGLL